MVTKDMAYIQQKADELIQQQKETGCAPHQLLIDAWDNPDYPMESLKLYSDHVATEVLSKQPYAIPEKDMHRVDPKTKILMQMTPLERMALECIRGDKIKNE